MSTDTLLLLTLPAARLTLTSHPYLTSGQSQDQPNSSLTLWLFILLFHLHYSPTFHHIFSVALQSSSAGVFVFCCLGPGWTPTPDPTPCQSCPQRLGGSALLFS